MYGTSVKLKTREAYSHEGESYQSSVFADCGEFNQPSSSTSTATSKVMDHDFLSSDLDDVNMVNNIGIGFIGSLGDASMDSFTDLSGILTENTFLGQPADKEEENATSVDFLDLDAEMKYNQLYWKGSLDETEEDPSSDLGKLSASVGLKRSRTPSIDHDYTTKRPRFSPEPVVAPSSEITEDPFLVPEPSPTQSLSPAPSCSSHTSETAEGDKKKSRREKNNLASKRSREIRKQKFTNMEELARQLTVDNAQLELRVEEMEKMAKYMKEILVTKLKIK